MTRENILEVVKKHLVEIVGDIEPARIDPVKSMKEMGANSLDIVEVVSCAMRELKVKVPRSELSKLTNIDGLVNLLFDTARAKAATTAGAAAN